MKTASDIAAHSEVAHDLVVRDIANNRFGLDEWTITTLPTELPAGAALAVIPHIIATHEDSIVAVGQVETKDFSSKQALKWKALGESCVRFYLYVPESKIEAACRLISEHDIACAGLRSFHYNGKLEIRPIHLDDVPCKDDDHPWWVALGGSDQVC